MKKYKEVLEKYNVKANKYQMMGQVLIVETEQGKMVIKPKQNSRENKEVRDYLNTRNFDYYPQIINEINEDFEITKYEKEIDLPKDQKITDMIELVSLLHSKTTHYVEVDEDYFKQIYEDVNNNIEYLFGYYNDIATIIESKVFMSPSEYLLIRNISKIYQALGFCKREIENWYEIVKNKRKKRNVVVHNNLDESHFIRNKNSYLISWDKSKIDIPVFDIYKLYRRHALDYEFSEILKRYEMSYPLLEEERKLFFILISLPDKIEFNQREYDSCRYISKKLDFIYKTEMLISPYYSENTKY